MSDSFVHLHVHTEYSMLDGAAKVGPLFTEAARLGMTVVGSVPHDEVPDAPDVDVLLMAGTFEQDVALVRRLRTRPALASDPTRAHRRG